MPPADPRAGSLAERVELIVRAAEREAARELGARWQEEEGAQEAGRSADEDPAGRVRRLADELAERSASIRDHLRALSETLHEVGASGGPAEQPRESAVPDSTAPEERAAAQRAPEPVAEEEPAAAPGPPEPPTPDAYAARVDAARLVAVELAVAGRSREEVAGHVRESFGIVDATALLDDVFGAEPAGGAGPPPG